MPAFRVQTKSFSSTRPRVRPGFFFDRMSCRSPFEKSQIAPVRNVTLCEVDMTPVGGGHTRAKRHHKQTRGEGEGVKGRSRRLPVRAAQPLRPSPSPSTMEQPCARPNHQSRP